MAVRLHERLTSRLYNTARRRRLRIRGCPEVLGHGVQEDHRHGHGEVVRDGVDPRVDLVRLGLASRLRHCRGGMCWGESCRGGQMCWSLGQVCAQGEQLCENKRWRRCGGVQFGLRWWSRCVGMVST